ncbi:MAG: glycerate kinase [Thermoplasmatales archaeon]|nr:glycerate kinase [Thermoplasmatales archaeon]
MKIVVAPGSFKGSLTASEVSDATEKGFRRIFPASNIVKIPMADGGDGTLECLVKATNGRIINEVVTGPLGKKVKACYGVLDDETVIIESASSSGLKLLKPEEYNPMLTTTYGTGELIKSALDKGYRKLIIGVGGSATNDAGAGMAQALGVRLLDSSGKNIPFGGQALSKLDKIDISEMDKRIAETEIVVACDVSNPLTGVCGAANVYGRQKGATPKMVKELDNYLEHFARIAEKDLGKKVKGIPGAGAAGGTSAGLMVFLDAKLKPGAELVAEYLKLSEHIKDADLVVTGEGKIDSQTVYGKTPVGVAKIAKKFGTPIIIIAGQISEGAEKLYAHGIDAMLSTAQGPISLEESISNAEKLVVSASESAARMLKTGLRMRK